MDRLCELTVTIGGYRKPREKSIMDACMVEWCFRKDDFGFVSAPSGRRKMLQATAMGTLYAAEEASQIMERMERAVWRANDGEICHVEVEAREYERNITVEPVVMTEDDAELQVA